MERDRRNMVNPTYQRSIQIEVGRFGRLMVPVVAALMFLSGVKTILRPGDKYPVSQDENGTMPSGHYRIAIGPAHDRRVQRIVKLFL